MKRRKSDFLILGFFLAAMCAYSALVAWNPGYYQEVLAGTVLFGLLMAITILFLPADRIISTGLMILIIFLPALYVGLRFWETHSAYRNVVRGVGPELAVSFAFSFLTGLYLVAGVMASKIRQLREEKKWSRDWRAATSPGAKK